MGRAIRPSSAGGGEGHAGHQADCRKEYGEELQT